MAKTVPYVRTMRRQAEMEAKALGGPAENKAAVVIPAPKPAKKVAPKKVAPKATKKVAKKVVKKKARK